MYYLQKTKQKKPVFYRIHKLELKARFLCLIQLGREYVVNDL